MDYVSRGGIKLARALKEFGVKVSQKICIDVGASTGGFTDVLLKNGAQKVYAIDVGYGILAWELRTDPRVVVVERTNARYLTPEKLYKDNPRAEIAVIDVSFISLSKVLPPVSKLIADKAEIVALIKPQFEARREEVERGGVIKDEKVRSRVIGEVKNTAENLGFSVGEVIESPIKGAKGNVEYFIRLAKG